MWRFVEVPSGASWGLPMDPNILQNLPPAHTMNFEGMPREGGHRTQRDGSDVGVTPVGAPLPFTSPAPLWPAYFSGAIPGWVLG